MGAKASLAGGPGGGTSSSSSSSLGASPTLESIQAAYEAGERDAALELIRLACGAGTPRPPGVRLLSLAAQHGDEAGVRFLLKEASVVLPQDPSDHNPAILAARHGNASVARALLDSVPGPCLRADLLNWMLSTACKQGHLDMVRLLVHEYKVDTQDCGIHSNDFAVITGFPLYAAAQAANEDIACFLLQSGAGFSSYTLMDHPAFSKHLLRRRVEQGTDAQGNEVCVCVLSMCWTGLQLPWLELDWFLDLSCRLTHMDLSSNTLSSLPSMVPWGLVQLQTLDLSDNLLRELPAAHSSQEVLCTSLMELNLSQNQLSSLPSGLLHLVQLRRLRAAKNQLTSLFHIPIATNWIGLRKLQELDVSDNALTSLPPAAMHCLKSLGSLNVSRNRLDCFPDPWACPLKQCKASSNAIQGLPSSMSVSWRSRLQEVDFTDNQLKEIPPYMFELEALVCLRLAGNQISTLPAADKWRCSKLRTLDLSRNQLGKTEEVPKSRRRAFLNTWTKRDPDPAVCPVEFPTVLRDSLEVLFLNDNHLEAVPASLCGLQSLNELYLANNPLIRELPVELGQLSNLWQLDVEDLNISNVPQEVLKEGAASILAFLRAHLRKAEPCRLLKMLLVGPPRQGKTALLEALNAGRTSAFSTTESSMSTSTWELDKPGGCRNAKDSVLFSVWDLGGPASMSTVNQCFFTDKALYVVLWNLLLGEEAVANLQTWLLSIEARAPNSAVVVVGTHLDLIDTKFRTERVATLRAYVLALCRSPSGARATGYPDITAKQLHEVSCRTLEGLDGLRLLLHQVVSSMKDHRTAAAKSQRLLGRLIPRSYLTLQEAVLAESRRRDAEDEVQYLTAAELDRVMEQNPGSDIIDYDDLPSAISFLIETGTLLHFPDTSHGLCTLYFLCPVWLSECLERIVHLKSSRSVARNGVIGAEDLRMLLVGTGFTQQTEEQYFQFLSKFEIALPVASNSYLLPHLLPSKPFVDILCLRRQTANSLQRLFKMNFVPAGFWERFIARMLISLTEMDLQTLQGGDQGVRPSGAAGSAQRRCGFGPAALRVRPSGAAARFQKGS
ncbi:unnamed protein product [Merluccius merluccius]